MLLVGFNCKYHTKLTWHATATTREIHTPGQCPLKTFQLYLQGVQKDTDSGSTKPRNLASTLK